MSSLVNVRAIARALNLHFGEPDLERVYRSELLLKTLPAHRVRLLLGALLYGGFGLLDGSIIPDVAHTAWLIRYVLVCPMILGVLALSYHKPSLPFLPGLTALAGLSGGMGIIAMISLAAPPGSYMYYAGLLMVCVALYTFLHLRFEVALFHAWCLVVAYELVAAAAGTPGAIVINNTFFLVGTNILGMIACYSSERVSRAAFLDRRMMETLAYKDSLTGALNRRAFFDVAQSELARCVRRNEPLSAVMLDVDHFKHINDQHGHLVGDRLLKEVASAIQASVRPSDSVCRYGGEEFVVWLPETGSNTARLVAERLRDAVEQVAITVEGSDVQVTASFGVATSEAQVASSVDALVSKADQALYSAKRNGRNQVALAAA
jgi:diguanylate cyclase (GGDEF)-like protein